MSKDGPTSTRRDLIKAAAGGVATAAFGAAVTGCSDAQDGTSGAVPKGRDTDHANSVRGDDAMSRTPLHYQTLSQVAELLTNGDLSSVDVTEHLLARIQALEPRLHAYYTVTAELALQQAAESDARRERGEVLGPLDGVPIAVKDLCRVEGIATTGGHSFRRNAIADGDATVIARLKAAGAVLLGKLATTEGAMTGYHRDFDVPRNPWGDLDRWPGVSSGGSGVATAAGLCFGSLGTDTGGSIRYPSAANGIVGLKPTWGRVSRHGVLDLAPTLDHIGPMTRSVRDAARLLGVIAGHDPNDPTALEDPVSDYEGALELGVEGLRIGFDESYASDGVRPHVAAAVRRAVEQLAGLGAEIVEISMPVFDEAIRPAWSTIASAEAAAVHAATFPSRAEEYGEQFRAFLESGHSVSEQSLAEAVAARQAVIEKTRPLFEQVDLLASPTLATETFRYQPENAYNGIDTDSGTISGVPLEWFGLSDHFIKIWDYNGYPTLSVPCGFSSETIPLSLQLVAAPLGEADLCRAGHAYEQDSEWHKEHPEL